MANDNLLAGIGGFLEGVKNVYVPFENERMKYGMEQQLALQKLKQEQAMKDREAATKFGYDKQLEDIKSQSARELQGTKEFNQNFILGSDIPDAFRPKGIEPDKYYRKEAITPFLNPKPTEDEKQAAKNKAKLDRELPKAEGSLRGVIANYDKMISDAEKIMNDPALGDATGILGSRNQITPGARRVHANMETLKGKTLLETLAAQRQLSATGASGFGNLSNVEGETLKNSAASLQLNQDTKDVKNGLADLASTLKAQRENQIRTFEETYGKKFEYKPVEAITPFSGQSGGSSGVNAEDLQVGKSFGGGTIKAVRWKK